MCTIGDAVMVYESSIHSKECAYSVSGLNAGIYLLKVFNREDYYNKSYYGVG
jgi:hypothetical protein